MRTQTIGDIIGKSVGHSRLVLFAAFSPRKWITLIFIAIMAGAMSGMTGSNLNAVSRAFRAAQNRQVAESTPVPTQGKTAASEPSAEKAAPAPGLVFLATLLSVLLYVVLMWLSARFKFIWYESVVRDSAAVIQPFKDYRRQGNSLFKFFLAFLFVLLILFVAALLWAAAALGLSGPPREGFQWLFSAAAGWAFVPLLGLVVLGLLAFGVNVVVEDFVLPIMALESCLFRMAWGKFAGIYRDHPRDVWLYLFLRMGLGILTALIQVAFSIVVILVFVVLGGILFGGSYAILVGLMKAKIVYAFVVALLLIPFVIALIFAQYSVGLPFSVFFRLLPLYYLASLPCPYRAVSFGNPEIEGGG